MGEFEERRMVARGHELRVRSGGEGPRDYVLVHGIGVSPAYFRPLAEELARRDRVHAVELPGFGQTPRPRHPLSIEDFAACVWEALDGLGVHAPVLVGHSMGAQVAVEMALQRRTGQLLALLGPTVDADAHSVVRQGLRLAWDTATEPPVVAATILRDYFRCGLAWYLATLRGMMRHRIEQRLALVAAPVLLLRGSRDRISPLRWLERLARSAPAAHVRSVPSHAHVVMYRGAVPVAESLRAEAARGDA
ncbi:alpha/beta fold hydrolase [Sinomonas atrocyanea]|jgi:pimeloyl-ACP methyl ester carboxylesterase|uniref:alpha/beta fold hydrolase n=1 Tax=Sinomonas atrocyanea TaxID=37927 RepID=UPI00278A93CB|nr:alpha/beta fold hydrolase [Sinomonas atrocyanea]MDQ0258887.1 pimeloyl-ACP methyl ester carboxylesterase [Sinomonas atrocyanea]MDR6622006.1 pimeloyl-ACP methyl ester carboxylesterase [Sinomonas atrocyanea]